jgi:type IV secretory pathway VirJ component
MASLHQVYRLRLFRASLILLVGPFAVSAQPGAANQNVSDLPLHEVRSVSSKGRLAVLMSGDGGWAAFDKDLATQLSERGINVVGLDSRAYLGTARSPEAVASDIARVMRYYRAAWNTTQVTLIGYSRGADITPFVFNRLPDDLRRTVSQIVLIGLAASANFQFHWQDLLRDVKRPGDLATRPEVEKMGATPVLCFYGDDDASDTCRSYASSASWRSVRHDGGHRPQDATLFVREIVAALPPTPISRPMQ